MNAEDDALASVLTELAVIRAKIAALLNPKEPIYA